MTKTRRVLNFLHGLLVFAAGFAFMFPGEGKGLETSIHVMLFLILLGLLSRGLGALFYYFTMGRYMVGGKTILFRSIILLDVGALAGSLIDYGVLYAALYLALLHAFSGVVEILRANESRRTGGHWKLKIAHGIANVLLSVTLVLTLVVFRQPAVVIYIYGAGLMYTAALIIASSFRRTDIVYIQ